MLTSTFVLLSGVGPATERRFWQEGLLTWEHFLKQSQVAGLSPHRKHWYDGELALAQAQFEAGHLSYFASRLPSREHWRFFPINPARTLYLDIETTGTAPHEGEVTLVGLHRNGETLSLIRGENLTSDRLQAELDQSDLLVTFFGSSFDVPFLRAKFPRLTISMPHFDLCFAARRVGRRGGLKQIEHDVGIERNSALHGLDGWDAVRLWANWCAGDAAALELLRDYNAADTANLVPLAHLLYDELLTRFGPPAANGLALTATCKPGSPI